MGTRVVPPWKRILFGLSTGTLFDVGGGNGIVSLALKNAGIDVVLVEPGFQGARNANARGLEKVICGTVEDSGFKTQSLPSVGIFDVLEHIENEKNFLEGVKALLVPKGRLYLTVPAYSFLWSKEDEHAGHLRRYTTHSLTQRLESAGYRIDFITYLFACLPIPIFFTRTLPSRLGLKKEAGLNRNAAEHRPSQPWIQKPLAWMLDREFRRLKAGRTIPFGGSCLAVATAV